LSEELESHLEPADVAPVGEAVSSRRLHIEPPPRAVLEGACRRDPAALEAFFDVYFEQVHSFACHLLGDRSKAEDVAQEVFLKLQRAIDRMDPERDPWPWIATMVHNACHDYWRSKAQRVAGRTRSLDADPERSERLVATAEAPEERVLADERERLVRAAIGRLSETHRQMVLLFNYDGLSHVEVAGLLGIGHAAARKRYSRALEELGRILRETIGR